MISWSDKMFQTAPSAFFWLLQVLLSTVHRHQGSPCRLCYFLKGPWTLGPASDETLPETVPTAQHYQLQSILTAMALLVGNAKRHGWPKRPSARLMTYEACLFCAGPGWPLLHHQDIHQCDLSSSRSSHRASMRKTIGQLQLAINLVQTELDWFCMKLLCQSQSGKLDEIRCIMHQL